MNSGGVYRVLVNQNLVMSLDFVESQNIDQISNENLEVAKKLAENYW